MKIIQGRRARLKNPTTMTRKKNTNRLGDRKSGERMVADWKRKNSREHRLGM